MRSCRRLSLCILIYWAIFWVDNFAFQHLLCFENEKNQQKTRYTKKWNEATQNICRKIVIKTNIQTLGLKSEEIEGKKNRNISESKDFSWWWWLCLGGGDGGDDGAWMAMVMKMVAVVVTNTLIDAVLEHTLQTHEIDSTYIFRVVIFAIYLMIFFAFLQQCNHFHFHMVRMKLMCLVWFWHQKCALNK